MHAASHHTYRGHFFTAYMSKLFTHNLFSPDFITNQFFYYKCVFVYYIYTAVVTEIDLKYTSQKRFLLFSYFFMNNFLISYLNSFKVLNSPQTRKHNGQKSTKCVCVRVYCPYV